METHTVRVSTLLPKNFLVAVDNTALSQGMSRSTFIRVALLEKMGLNNMFDIPSPAEIIAKEQAADEAFLKSLKYLVEEEPDE